MALRLARKINRHLVQKNPIKTLSEKSTAANPKCLDVEKSGPEENGVQAPPPSQTQVFRYQVCRPKTSPVNRVSDIVAPPTPIMVDLLKNCPVSSPVLSNKFGISKTVQNVSLPLKMPRLASPFPEPVKVMPSHTTSDLEKADQMRQEAKCSSGGSSGAVANMQRRFFSSDTGNVDNLDPSKCKKLNKVGTKKSCPKMVAPGCKPPKSISCHRRPPVIECTKKEAPYPSYSETCHEDLEMKPSECRMCPWKPEENPNFKQPKKKFHSSARLFDLRKGECGRGPNLEKEPCGWIKHGKDECDEKTKNKTQNTKGKKNQEVNKKKNKFSVPEVAVFDEASTVDGYLFDVRKKPCKPPPKKPCDTPKHKKEVVKKKKKEEECPDMIDNVLKREREYKKSPPKKAMAFAIQNIDNLLLNTSDFDGMQLTKKVGNVGECTDKCKKLPFDKCVERKRKPLAESRGGCPKKPKKKKIIDCPKEDEEKCTISIGSGLEGMQSPLLTNVMSLASEKDNDKPKCPKVNLGVCRDEEVDDDPCNRKRRGRTDTCKPNLLERYKNKKGKPKPKKKTSGYVPLPVLKLKPGSMPTKGI